jgi:hypothetical protein
MMRTGLQRIEENVQFLKSVPLLQNLDDNVLSKIADVLELVSWKSAWTDRVVHTLQMAINSVDACEYFMNSLSRC